MKFQNLKNKVFLPGVQKFDYFGEVENEECPVFVDSKRGEKVVADTPKKVIACLHCMTNNSIVALYNDLVDFCDNYDKLDKHFNFDKAAKKDKQRCVDYIFSHSKAQDEDRAF